MELLFEILFEVYGELMFLIIPEKRLNKKYVIATKVISVLVFLGVIALALWGVVLITDYHRSIGILAIAFVVLGVIGLVDWIRSRERRKDK